MDTIAYYVDMCCKCLACGTKYYINMNDEPLVNIFDKINEFQQEHHTCKETVLDNFESKKNKKGKNILR